MNKGDGKGGDDRRLKGISLTFRIVYNAFNEVREYEESGNGNRIEYEAN